MDLVRCEIADRVATVTLNDPERRNALSQPMVDQIVALFDALEANPDVGAVVVTGEPPAFCAGADLSHLSCADREGLRGTYEGFLRLARSPLPTIAAVNGAAVGAGMNMALACDLRLAVRTARFDTRFLQLGLHPGGGHTWMLRNIAGAQTAFACVLFGEVLDGQAAERCGLVWRCVEDGALLATAHELASRAAAGPPDLVRKIKGSIRSMGSVVDHETAVERELDPQVWSVSQPEFRERIAALQQRIAGRKK